MSKGNPVVNLRRIFSMWSNTSALSLSLHLFFPKLCMYLWSGGSILFMCGRLQHNLSKAVFKSIIVKVQDVMFNEKSYRLHDPMTYASCSKCMKVLCFLFLFGGQWLLIRKIWRRSPVWASVETWSCTIAHVHDGHSLCNCKRLFLEQQKDWNYDVIIH